MDYKKCKKCGLYSIKKNGKRNWKQRYKCSRCWYVFENKSRKKLHKKLREDYVQWKQTYSQLAKKHKVSIKTIQRRLDQIAYKKRWL